MTYKLPHLLDRPGQQDAMDWILNSDKQYLILRAPTGFGKSPLAATASIEFRTLALVLHKSLQSANYQDQYNFNVLYGKANYPCIEKNKSKQVSFIDQPKFTAYDCSNPDCDCPYQRQELQCLSSLRVSLNYAKFLMSRPLVNSFRPEYLFLDEAHNLPNIITNFVGFTLNWNNEFLAGYNKIKPDKEYLTRLPYNLATSLFRQCAIAVKTNKPDISNDLKLWRRWKRLNQKINIVNTLIGNSDGQDWYYETNEKQLIIKPLTAKYHFKELFGVAGKIILMSATIGPSIAKRLGLEDDEWDYHEVPNPWPIPTRLIYDLGGPAINYNSSNTDKHKNRELIASILSPNKSGIIHVTSRPQAYELQRELGKIFEYDFFVPSENIGTEEQYQEWVEYRRICPLGSYCISWNFHEGVDLGKDDISITAKVPWVNFSSNYESVKKDYDPQWYLEQAAMKLEQSCGRIRRGMSDHYLPGAKQVYIADSSWHRLKTLLSDDFRKSIRIYNGTS